MPTYVIIYNLVGLTEHGIFLDVVIYVSVSLTCMDKISYDFVGRVRGSAQDLTLCGEGAGGQQRV